jgi:hypothetical protein
VNTREAAKAVLQVLSSAVPEGGAVTLEEPGTYTARFSDPFLGERIMPAETQGGPLAPTGESGDRTQPTIVDGRLAIAWNEHRGKWAICRVDDPQPLEWQPTFALARARADQLSLRYRTGTRPPADELPRGEDKIGDYQP